MLAYAGDFLKKALIISLRILSSPHAFPFFNRFTAFITSASKFGEFSLSEYSLVTQLDLLVKFTLSSNSVSFVSSVEFNRFNKI